MCMRSQKDDEEENEDPRWIKRNVPFTPELFGEVDDAAAREDRSFVAQVRELCREALEARKVRAPAEKPRRA